MVDVLVDLNRLRAAERSLRHPDGAGGLRARRDARPRPRLVPRLRLAARAGAAAPRPRGALRVGLLDPASGRREAAARPRRRRARFDRPARLGRGLPARSGLGRPRRDERPDGRRGAHPARLHAGPRDRGAPSPGALPGPRPKEDDKVAETFASRCPSSGCTSPRASPCRTPRKPWSEIVALGPHGRRARSSRVTCG